MVKKKLRFAGKYNGIGGDFSIRRIDSNKLVLYGFEVDTASRNDTIRLYQPYVYLFNNQGDSLSLAKEYHPQKSRLPLGIVCNKDGSFFGYGIAFSETWHWYNFGRRWVPDTNFSYIAKYDSIGSRMWTKYYTSANSFYKPYQGLPSGEGGILLAVSGPLNGYGEAPHIICYDNSGNEAWKRSYRPNNYEEMDYVGITPAANQGLYFACSMADLPENQNGPGGSKLFFGQIKSNGDTLWTKNFAIPGEANGHVWTEGRSILQRPNKDLVMSTVSYYDAYYHPSLYITDSIGNMKYYREYQYVNSGFLSQSISNLRTTPHNTILMAGNVGNQNPIPGLLDPAGSRGWIIHTDSFGCIQPGCQAEDTIWQVSPVRIKGTVAQTKAILLFPNPATDKVHLSGEGMAGGVLSLIDASGRTVLMEALPADTHLFQISNLPSGTYIASLRYKDGSVQGFKLVKR